MPSLSYSATTEDRLPYPLPTNNSVSNPRFINSSPNLNLNAPISRLQRKPSFGNSRQIAHPSQNESHEAIGESRRQPRKQHSRSSSASGIKEPAGNFNRWSQSTASSAGGHTRSRSNSISRLSFGGSGLHGNVVGQSPPRKLQKSRPSIDNSPQRRRPTDRLTNPPLQPSLPPIITLPIPQQSGSHSPSPLASALTPSTAGLLSAAVHSTVPDYFGKTEGSRPRDISQRRSPSRSGNHSISPSPISVFSTEAALRPRPSEEELGIVRGHSRNRSRAEKSSTSSRSSKQPSQKAMLSKALQKANTAVLLDNAQNYEGAMQAYSEACSLLQQVMARSSGDEDRRKLEAIRNTYTSRINELSKITPESSDEKALPARPEDTDFRSGEFPMSDEEEEEEEGEEEDLATIETATMTRIVNDTSYSNETQNDRSYSRSRQLPSRSQSLLPSALESPQTQYTSYPDQRSNYFSRYNPSQGRNIEMSLAVPMDSHGANEAEFDAALDAAVEAAYDDGFEPVDPEPHTYGYSGDDDDRIVANVRRKVELAKERETNQKRKKRMLDEMTRGYVMDDFEFGLQSKSALPRESDSSGSFSGRTWHSSNGSIPPLTTVSDTTIPPVTLSQSQIQPLHPPPTQALPPPPVFDESPARNSSPSQSVRSRRLSGQNAKQLKIETSSRLIEVQNAPLTLPPSMPPPQVPDGNAYPKTAGLPQQRPSSISMRPPIPIDHTSPPTAFLTQTLTNDSSENSNHIPRSASPHRSHSRAGLRKNFSSSSLKNARSHHLSVSNMDEFGDLMPPTPSTAQVNNANGRIPAMPTLPTPIAAAFKEKMNGAPAGGLYLFNSDLHSPDSPGSPNPMNAGAPIPLEPCPTEYLLRPFWLMRALYQTIAHPRGGYLSTKLFIPRDVWRVKGVKIKGVEDKIANYAVLEEMQSLEGILEQVQVTLSKKLGSEVGVHGSNGMFKDATMGENMDFANMSSKSGSVSSKASSFSWRRFALKEFRYGSFQQLLKQDLDSPKETLIKCNFSGPNANYMSALARLFDAAQVIDQIARQVEDPGLRHADKTQVGLELCTRHAAEFFGFYICRFVLTDISLLLDKFIKRGSEWVLV
ncbi:hypothetical protein DID88_006833 [Monilinia fructigena]|uniref:MIT domain-containing protein n=1 Tax=Monilinia fructigena TaxID=38457 RepID=A0A395IG96_9HELO|nr:hypothetical protein DID88_006833 [Monilinia fructigena]